MSATRITFLGAAGTVTGSRFLRETGAAFVLVDCALLQGQKHIRRRDWEPIGVLPRTIDAVDRASASPVMDRAKPHRGPGEGSATLNTASIERLNTRFVRVASTCGVAPRATHGRSGRSIHDSTERFSVPPGNNG